MTFEEEDKLMVDAFRSMDQEISTLKGVIALAELCMKRYREAWAIVQKYRAKEHEHGP